MYHDQGQIALKVIGFDGGVTVQGGLPVVIATPAHGTAFDIAGKNIASIKSSQNALDIAIAVATQKVARDNARAASVQIPVKGSVDQVQIAAVTV
jgi:4-hydroxythreonine-4-phosphate dehydrogenase